MKKLLKVAANIGLVAIFILLLAPISGVNAQSSSTDNLFGQTQAYDVLLRGNGDAVVNARFTVSNSDDSPKSKFSYSVASGNLKSVSAFQQISCSGLPTLMNANATPSTSNTGTAANSASPTQYPTTTNLPECYPTYVEKNGDINSSGVRASSKYYYPNGGTIYKKITVTTSGNSFVLSLPQEIKNNKTATIVMVYDVSGVSNKKLGVYHYDFKTLKSTERTSAVNVAISVDEGYYLADTAKGNVNYKSNSVSSSLDTALSSGANSSASNSVSSYVSSIGNNGMVEKQASQIGPQETFTVKGRFATSTFLLNWPRTVLRWAILIAIIGLVVFWYLHRRKRLQKQEANLADQPQTIIDNTEVVSTPETEDVPEEQPEPETVEETKTAEIEQKTVSTNIRSIPFYGVYNAAKLKFHQRSIRPMFFAWICALYLLIFGVIMAVGFIYASNFGGNSSYYNLPTSSKIIVTGTMYISLAIASILGTLLICIGLPFLYAQTARGTFRIITHIVLFFIIVAIITAFISIFIPEQSYRDDYSYPNCGSGSICVQ